MTRSDYTHGTSFGMDWQEAQEAIHEAFDELGRFKRWVVQEAEREGREVFYFGVQGTLPEELVGPNGRIIEVDARLSGE